MRIFITGGSGFVGSYFLNSLGHQNFLVPSHQELDITQKKSIFYFFTQNKPAVVINFAALVNPGESEKERGDKNGLTWQTNALGPANLAEACRNHDAFLIQISTDAIFPGTKECPGPYPEEAEPPDQPDRLNWYGLSKLVSEEAIKKSGARWAIVRISLPFGQSQSKKDSLNKTIQGIRAGGQIFTDQFITPTFLPDLVKVLEKIIAKQTAGIYHVACQGLITRMEFAQYLAQKLNLSQPLIPGSAVEFMKQPGRPPISLRGGLLTEKTEKQLGLKFQNWQEAIDQLDLRIEFFAQ